MFCLIECCSVRVTRAIKQATTQFGFESQSQAAPQRQRTNRKRASGGTHKRSMMTTPVYKEKDVLKTNKQTVLNLYIRYVAEAGDGQRPDVGDGSLRLVFVSRRRRHRTRHAAVSRSRGTSSRAGGAHTCWCRRRRRLDARRRVHGKWRVHADSASGGRERTGDVDGVRGAMRQRRRCCRGLLMAKRRIDKRRGTSAAPRSWLLRRIGRNDHGGRRRSRRRRRGSTATTTTTAERVLEGDTDHRRHRHRDSGAGAARRNRGPPAGTDGRAPRRVTR